LQASEFPELKALRDNWRTIRDEALALYGDGHNGHIRTAPRHNDWGFHSFFRSGWSRFYLKWYEDFLPSARDLCPKTVALLDTIPSVHGAMFAMLPAHARLGPHRDPFAGSLRYHLGLVTPNSDRCCIYVDGQFCTWRDGEDFVFDETYIHRAENLTDQKRIILFCDVERPLKSAFITRLNRWVSNNLVKATATQNFDGERVGIINKLFGGVYEIHLAGQRIKKRNRSAYYALKYGVIAITTATLVVSALYL
jgi:beta-hydroxylase